jgi:hypothetical protein
MRQLRIMLLALAALLPAAAGAQGIAGRFLAAAGTVTIERGLQALPAAVGTTVIAGDTLRVGPQSNAQVRFTDDSVVALGPDSAFRVSEYAYESVSTSAQRVVFTLVAGGMRTVTGLIGKANVGNYRLQTPVAALGIRGTGFSACQDCTSTDGEFLPGTSVSFSEGAGYLRTDAGELELVAGQSAYARDATSLPIRTLAFPQLRQQASARPSSPAGTAQSSEEAQVAVPGGGGGGAAPVGDSTAAVANVVSTPTTPVFQVTSTPAVETVLAPTSGTAFYRVAGPFNIPTACSSGPCDTVVDGEFVLAVNYSVKRVTALGAFRTAGGDVLNISIPINLSGAPITIVGNQVTFTGTYNAADFPFNGGSFACSNCGPNNTPGQVQQLTVSGTINGSQATLTFAGTGGSVTVTMSQQNPPNNSVAALFVPTQNGGASARSASYWDVTVDSSGRLVRFGPPVGAVQGDVGGATNTIVGTAPAAGNLVWGTWTNGTTAATKATLVDSQYHTYQPNNNSVLPWITGEASPFLPPSLGVLDFNLLGSVMTNTSAHVNSAKLQADFVNRSVQLSINATAAPGTTGTNVYQMNATTGFSPTSNRFSGGFNTVTCTGPCNAGVGTASGSFGGFFAGSQAQGAGLTFTTGFGSAAGANGVGNGVSGAIAFGR